MEKSSQQSSEVLKEILGDLDQAAQEMDHGTMEKEALQEGGNHEVPISDGKKGTIQSAGMPVLSNPGEAHHTRVYEVFQENPGVDGRRSANAVGPQDFRKYCTEGVMAILGSMLLGMVFCFAIYQWRKRQKRLAAASRAQPNTRSYPASLDSRPPQPNTPESGTQSQQPLSSQSLLFNQASLLPHWIVFRHTGMAFSCAFMTSFLKNAQPSRTALPFTTASQGTLSSRPLNGPKSAFQKSKTPTTTSALLAVSLIRTR
ncbi:uncharacterized protein FYN16_006096 [Cariama cristata]